MAKTQSYRFEEFWVDLKSGKFASMVKESAKGKKLKNSKEVYHILKPLFAKGDDIEKFICLFLDSQNQIITIEQLFSGSLCHTTSYRREIIKKVLELKALFIIVAHNHPSGCVEPSKEDIEVTRKIKQAMECIEGSLLDHLIIGNGYKSLADEKLI